MKTLKEAYDSVGLKLQVGDQLGNCGKIRFVDGWCFDYDDPEDVKMLVVYDGRRYTLNANFLPITRDGKQIYPKIEESTNRVVLERERLNAQLTFALNVDRGTAWCTAHCLEQFIDAKIKEAKNEK